MMTRVAILLLVLPHVAFADIGRRETKPKPSAPAAKLTFAERLDELLPVVMKDGGEHNVEWVTAQKDGLPREPPAGLPQHYWELLLAHRTNSFSSLRAEGESLGQASREFDAVWEKVQAHQVEVDAALAEAKKLVAGKSFDGARQVLSHVVSETPLDDNNDVPKRTAVLAPEDAELPAILALAPIAKQLHDRKLIVDITLSLLARRKVLDKDGALDKESERLVWLAAARGGAVHLVNDLNQGHAAGLMAEIDRKADGILANEEGIAEARGFFKAWPEYGLRVAELADPKSVKVGDYAVFPLLRTKFTKIDTPNTETLSYKSDSVRRWLANCTSSDRIDSVDPVTGKVGYATECEQMSKHTKVTLRAKFSVKMKSADNEKFTSFMLMGRVVKVGPDWVVDDAQFPGLAFMYDVAHEWWVWEESY